MHFIFSYQAIATNLTVMAGLKVPIVTIMVGEGGNVMYCTVVCCAVECRDILYCTPDAYIQYFSRPL